MVRLILVMLLSDKARLLLEELLPDIPIENRDQIKEKGLVEAEKISKFKEMSIIEDGTLIAGLVAAIPYFMQEQFRRILDMHGIDAKPFENYFQKSF